jgi:hypothetical protein
MRKEKFSYLVLLAEVIAIIWLHSTKKPSTEEIGNTPLVKSESTQSVRQPLPVYVQTAYPAR